MSTALKRPVTAIVLAAGTSSRMGERNKLLLSWSGKRMVEVVVDALVVGGCEEVVVVVGHQREAVAAALAGKRVRMVDNPHYAEGLSTSIRAGIDAAGAGGAGYLFALGDMPGLKAATVAALRRAFAALGEQAIVVPTRCGRRGNPVVFSPAYGAELGGLSGDVGARSLLAKYSSCVVELEVDDDGILIDVDTPDAYRRQHATDAPATE
jgi:molybdenum cofactor cytidylyltransferase